MPIDRDLRAQLDAHIEFFGELGVTGISRDAAWREPLSGGQEEASAPPREAAAGELAGEADRPTPRDSPRDAPATIESPSPASVTAVAAAPALFEAGGAGAPQETLDDIRRDIGDCTRCKLCGLGRRTIVFGVGHPTADLMFVGEAPGYDEDAQGIPFVGRAGQLLTKIIEAMGLRREDVYIANVIKCRPPDNRNPEPDEVRTCEPFLFRQIDVIQPKVIVALGTFAAQCLLKTNAPISKLRGRLFPYRGAQLVPTFHPAYLLRSPDKKRDCWEDMKKVMALLRDA